jgi:uncharacterized membrane protein (UPF0127 family)
MPMVFNRSSLSGNLSVTLIISGVVLTIGGTFLLFVLPNLLKPETKLWLGDGVFTTDIALTQQSREKGLSGRPSLDSDKAMLLAFPTEGEWGIWMKGMNFPIDIVWLNKAKKVIWIRTNVSQDDTATYKPKPKLLAKYVVELPAGTVRSKAINLNSVANFLVEEDIK